MAANCVAKADDAAKPQEKDQELDEYKLPEGSDDEVDTVPADSKEGEEPRS